MANKGWDGQAGGRTVSSNARTTMRTSGTEGAEGFIRGSDIAHPHGPDNDTLEDPGDRFEPPGQMDISHGCSN
jgi:hypothetical protein